MKYVENSLNSVASLQVCLLSLAGLSICDAGCRSFSVTEQIPSDETEHDSVGICFQKCWKEECS